jgi:4a-hydroxytetrahydrobiopterin dehydratase
MRRQCDWADALDHRMISFQAAERATRQGGYTMTATLADKTCTPCRGGIPPLTLEEAEGYRAQAPAWALRDEATRIERTYRFRSFAEAFKFVCRAATLAEAEAHHPDISFGWGYATVSLRTKKIKGLHENDFIMAVKLDRLANAAADEAAD